MKKIIFVSLLLVMVSYSFAAEDITPKRFDFKSMPIGPLQVDHIGNGKVDPTPLLKDGGVIQLGNGNFSTNPNHEDVKKIQDGLSIIDLGGTVGKVLCFKGSQSTYGGSAINKASGDLAVPWFDLNFFLDKEKTPTTRKVYGDPTAELGHALNEYRMKAIVRATIIFKMVDEAIDAEPGSNKTVTVQGKFGNGVAASNASFSSFSFATATEDPETGEAVLKYNENDWMKVQVDHYANEAGALPYWFNLNLSGSYKAPLNKKVILIKSITLTTNYQLGEEGFYKNLEEVGWNLVNSNAAKSLPAKFEKVQLTSVPLSVKNETLNDASCYASGNGKVIFTNLVQGEPVHVYSMNGQLVSRFTATDSTSSLVLDKGCYIARMHGKSMKVVVY